MLLQQSEEKRVASGVASTETEGGQVVLPNKYFSARSITR